mgnify:CR=1 FL=1
MNRLVLVMTLCMLGGCYSPGGGMMSHDRTPMVYYSTPERPKTVVIVDTRTGENIWEQVIPPGKQRQVEARSVVGDDPRGVIQRCG